MSADTTADIFYYPVDFHMGSCMYQSVRKRHRPDEDSLQKKFTGDDSYGFQEQQCH